MANKRSWSATPPKKIKPTVPGSTQSMLKEKADKLIDNVIKPTHVKPAPTTDDFNYIAENGTGIIFIFVQPITARVQMLYRPPLKQNLHAWNMLLTTGLILLTCGIMNNGLKCFRIFRWMIV